MPPRIAVLLACYNRKATTVASLRGLERQRTTAELAVFLSDDASPDGTAEAVRAAFPRVHVLEGDGELFWGGGMRLAFAAAMAQDFDFYLWLNDDTLLDDDALARLLAAHDQVRRGRSEPAIVVGSTRDPRTGALTYGGVVRASRFHPLKYRLLPSGGPPQPCHTMNGNCVLIPRAATALAGNLSPEFRHSMGDFDYGLRARRAGCGIWVAPGTVGTCARNSVAGGFRDPSRSLRHRWRAVLGQKGLPPRQYLVYARRHGGPLWPLYWALPYARVILNSCAPRLSGASKSTHERV